MMANARKAQRQKERKVRIPFGGQRLNLELSEEDLNEFKRRKMVPRWVTAKDGRIEAALAGGYNFVKPEHATSLGQGALHGDNTDEGSKVSKIVNPNVDGIAKRAYLMEISEKFWKEDQKIKEDRNRKIDEALQIGEAGGVQVENKYGPGVTYSH